MISMRDLTVIAHVLDVQIAEGGTKMVNGHSLEAIKIARLEVQREYNDRKTYYEQEGLSV